MILNKLRLFPNVYGSKRFHLFPPPDCPSSLSFQDSSSSTESPVRPESPLLTDTVMVIFASTLLVLALLISFISYVSEKFALTNPSHRFSFNSLTGLCDRSSFVPDLTECLFLPSIEMFKEYTQRQDSDGQERSLPECAAQTVGEKGLDADLHVGSQNIHDEAHLRLKTVWERCNKSRSQTESRQPTQARRKWVCGEQIGPGLWSSRMLGLLLLWITRYGAWCLDSPCSNLKCCICTISRLTSRKINGVFQAVHIGRFMLQREVLIILPFNIFA